MIYIGNLKYKVYTHEVPYDAEIEYLSSTGTQSINTGYIPTGSTKVEIKVKAGTTNFIFINSSSYKLYTPLFGILNSGAHKYWAAIVGSGTSNKLYYYNSYTQEVYPNYTPAMNSSATLAWQTYVFDGTTVTRNGTTLTGSATNPANSPDLINPMYLFDLNDPNGDLASLRRGTSYIDIAYCKIWSGDGTLVRDYIPVRVGQVGYMYDKVTGQLQGNQGTGNFVLGNDVKVVNHAKKIIVPNETYIADGLVFHLDGINKGSNENAWTDLKRGIIFTPTGNVVFNDNNISINADNTYLQASATLGNSTNNTVEVCYYTTKSTHFIFGEKNGQNYPLYYNNNGRITFMQSNSTYTSHVASNKYNTISLNLDRAIANGSNLTQAAADWWTASNAVGLIRIGKGMSGGAQTYYFTGKIYSIRIYNRRLTEAEMLHNQRVDNKRFNLGLTI